MESHKGCEVVNVAHMRWKMIGDGVCANLLVDFVSNLQKKHGTKTDKTSHQNLFEVVSL